jgi:hypothetical protein
MKSRSDHILKYILICVVLSMVFVSSSFARDDSNEQRDDERMQKYALIDQEKQLLRQSDDLSLAIFETKRGINDLHKRLDGLEEGYSSVKHALISVQLKLIR